MAQLVKNPPAMWRPRFDPWVGKTPGEGKGYPLQYSGLENSMDCIVRGVTKSRTGLSDFHFHISCIISVAFYPASIPYTEKMAFTVSMQAAI